MPGRRLATSRFLAASLLTLALAAAGCGGDDDGGGDAEPSGASGGEADAVLSVAQVIEAAREVPGY